VLARQSPLLEQEYLGSTFGLLQEAIKIIDNIKNSVKILFINHRLT
jgi:hypothetical protein